MCRDGSRMDPLMRTHHRRSFHGTILALASVAALTGLPAYGDSYPSKPVKIILQTAPGAAPDVLGRMIANGLTQTWGQQLLMVNRPGAGGLLAAQAAVTADPDGYTLYQATTGSLLVLPVTQKLNFDVTRDLTPIGLMAEQPFFHRGRAVARREHTGGIDRFGEETSRRTSLCRGRARWNAAPGH